MLVSKQTVNTVSKFIDSCDNNSIYEINIEGTDVKIKRNLSLEERAKFVTLAATSCFDDDGMYLPELELFFWRYAIIKFFTNLELPAAQHNLETFLLNSNAYCEIEDHIECATRGSLDFAVSEKINYLKSYYLSQLAPNPLQETAHKINNFLDSLLELNSDEKIADLKLMLEKMDTLNNKRIADTVAVEQHRNASLSTVKNTPKSNKKADADNGQITFEEILASKK